MITPYETDIRRVIKWLHNEAVYLPHYIENKAAWYDENDEKFWANWAKNVFDIRTANPFGLIVWCVILGVPTSLFDVKSQGRKFAFGEDRQNFVGSATTPGAAGPGGNFISTNDTIRDVEEIRKMLRLRYASMINGGNLQFINKMLNFIFNDGKPWDPAGLEYMYVADSTCRGFDLTRRFYRNDWRGTTEIKIGVDSHNYFPQCDVKVFPDGAAATTPFTAAQVPDGLGSDLGRRLTGAAAKFMSYTHSPIEPVLPPVAERTLVYGVCVRNPTTDSPKYTHVRVDVYESEKAFGPNNPFATTKNRISSDIIDLRPKPDQKQVTRDGLMVKTLDATATPFVWVEAAARFTPTGRAACLAVVPCDPAGNELADATGAVLDVWFPINRTPSDSDAYWRAASQNPGVGGKWALSGGKLSHLRPDGNNDTFDKIKTTFHVIGVDGHNRTAKHGDVITPDGISATADKFTIHAMSHQGSAPPKKSFEYRIGANTEISERFLAILRERKNDIMFQHSGIPYTVTRES